MGKYKELQKDLDYLVNYREWIFLKFIGGKSEADNIEWSDTETEAITLLKFLPVVGDFIDFKNELEEAQFQKMINSFNTCVFEVVSRKLVVGYFARIETPIGKPKQSYWQITIKPYLE